MPQFNPFSSRACRDVRNQLSVAFVESLEEMNPTGYRRAAEALLDAGTTPSLENYLRDKLERYEKAFMEVGLRRPEGVLARAQVLWKNELYFEVHELLESEWKETSGTARDAMKAMIQAAGVFVHLKYGRAGAAAGLARKAAATLRRCREELASFEGLDGVIEALEKVGAGGKAG